MPNRNPFEIAERFGRAAVTAAGYILLALAVALVAGALSDYYGWGWWVLLIAPGVMLGAFLGVILAGLLRLAADSIHDAWLIAKWRWDDRHPKE